MSRSSRIALAVLISLAVIVGIYTTAFGASLWSERTGAHMVSGTMVNLDHYRVASTLSQTYQAQQTPTYQNEGGHHCNHDAQSSPQD